MAEPEPEPRPEAKRWKRIRALTTDGTQIERATAVAVSVAIGVLEGDDAGLAPGQAAKRRAFASKVLQSPEAHWAAIAWAAASTDTVQDRPTPADITWEDYEEALLARWDALAGVNPADKSAPTV